MSYIAIKKSIVHIEEEDCLVTLSFVPRFLAHQFKHGAENGVLFVIEANFLKISLKLKIW